MANFKNPVKRFIAGVLLLSMLVSSFGVGPVVAEATPVSGRNVERIAGNTRYETALASADMFMQQKGLEQLDSIIIASGTEFADALAGSYLAVVKQAPILLSKGSNNKAQLHDYIRANLKQGGTVYILGGEKAVPAAIGTGLDGYVVKRLFGATRYETNLEILKEAGVTGGELLVCTGTSFADSLSASAVGKPILLVKDSLSSSQKAFLNSADVEELCVLGGTSAVSQKLEQALAQYADVTRIGGATRYETSVLVAKHFFASPEAAVLTYALNYPDGLCGGLLAHHLQSPIILTRAQNADIAKAYVSEYSITEGMVLGGEALITDDTVRYIFDAPQSPAKVYTITYELNGGTNAADNPSQYTEGTATALQNPSKEHYIFAGWYLDSAFSTQITAISAATAGNLTLYAKWEPVSYTVSYVLNGGTNAAGNPSQYAYGTSTALQNPSKEYFTFAGWYLDPAFSTQITAISAATAGNLTLYAKWTPCKYTVTYELNGGQNSVDNPTAYAYGESYTLADPVSGPGVFQGWYLDSNYTMPVTQIKATDSGNMTLYAKWEMQVYSITYVLDGGKNSPRNPSEYTTGTAITLQNASSKLYHSFGGWYLDSNFETQVTEIPADSTGDLTLYGKWIPYSYTITYNLNKGENSSDNPETYSYGDSFDFATPTRENHTFDGWYLESSFKTKVEGVTATSTGDLTLYAKWHLAQLNIAGEGMDNMIWSWWYYPQVVSTSDTVYWGYASNDGYSGVAAYDIATGKTTTTALKRITPADDHNGLAVTQLDDGRIMCIYAGGHDANNEMHVRISSKPNSIEEFDTNIILRSVGKTCYCQIIQQNGKIYIFYRVNSKSWAYRSSADGVNWSDEVLMVSADAQYYCKVMPTTKEGFVRICMYSNPTATDPRIRMGFMDLETGKIYNADGTTELGTQKVAHTKFDVLIDQPEGKIQRMFDVAITDPQTVRILYTVFSNSKTANDSVYYLYNSDDFGKTGTSVKICDGGVPLWNPKYQGGASFAGNDTVVVARNASNKDFIEIYKYQSGQMVLQKLVHSESVGGGRNRNARPIVDVNGKFFLWHSGDYNPNSYTDFNTDAMIGVLS